MSDVQLRLVEKQRSIRATMIMRTTFDPKDVAHFNWPFFMCVPTTLFFNRSLPHTQFVRVWNVIEQLLHGTNQQNTKQVTFQSPGKCIETNECVKTRKKWERAFYTKSVKGDEEGGGGEGGEFSTMLRYASFDWQVHVTRLLRDISLRCRCGPGTSDDRIW